MAPNISLQNLIINANDKKEEVVKKLKAKQDQMLQVKNMDSDYGNQSPSKADQAQEYINSYRMLEIRTSVMQEEF